MDAPSGVSHCHSGIRLGGYADGDRKHGREQLCHRGDLQVSGGGPEQVGQLTTVRGLLSP